MDLGKAGTVTYNNLSEALFHGQLPMFMTAGEIKKHYQPSFGDREETEDENGWRAEHPTEVLDRKARESREYGSAELDGDYHSTLAESIARRGVENPISLQFRATAIKENIGRPQVLGGHHRVAIAAENHPNDLLPVEHFASMTHAQKILGVRY